MDPTDTRISQQSTEGFLFSSSGGRVLLRTETQSPIQAVSLLFFNADPAARRLDVFANELIAAEIQ